MEHQPNMLNLDELMDNIRYYSKKTIRWTLIIISILIIIMIMISIFSYIINNINEPIDEPIKEKIVYIIINHNTFNEKRECNSCEKKECEKKECDDTTTKEKKE